MKRMVTDEQIIDLIQKYAPGFDPSTIEDGNVPQDAILGLEEGEIVKGSLNGKYVRIINASDIPSRLTNAFINEYFANGCFVMGTYLGLKNPVFMPCNVVEGAQEAFGIIIGGYVNEGMQGGIFRYRIAGDRTIQLDSTQLKFGYGELYVMGLFRIYGKRVPAYPTGSGKYTYKLDNGTLIWQEGNGLYLHIIVFNVGAGQSFTIRLISDSATICAVDAGTGNFTIPGSTFIQPANMGNVVIIPFNANQFTPDIYAFDSATGTFTDNITLASVTSDTVTPIG